MVSQLTAINVAKVITIALVITLIALVGITNQRQILYACMHISYCLWWLIEQRIYPERRTFLFQDKVGPIGLISAILIIGVFYSLPAFLAFFNPNPLTIAATATAVPLFYFGRCAKNDSQNHGSRFGQRWNLEPYPSCQLQRRSDALSEFCSDSRLSLGLSGPSGHRCALPSTHERKRKING